MVIGCSVEPLTAGASAGIEVNAAAAMTAAMINATAALARTNSLLASYSLHLNAFRFFHLKPSLMCLMSRMDAKLCKLVYSKLADVVSSVFKACRTPETRRLL